MFGSLIKLESRFYVYKCLTYILCKNTLKDIYNKVNNL